MNRVLSFPHTSLMPGMLEVLQSGRHRTTITRHGMVRFMLPGGPVEMKLSGQQAPIDPGTEVYVWWKGGGFVCAPVGEVKAEERRSRTIEKQVRKARETIAAARAERWARESAYAELAADTPAEPAREQPVTIF